VQADAQDGLGLNDGATPTTPTCPPRRMVARAAMQMYVFDGASPGRDGSLDAQIVCTNTRTA